jgi:hypothetical protein
MLIVEFDCALLLLLLGVVVLDLSLFATELDVLALLMLFGTIASDLFFVFSLGRDTYFRGRNQRSNFPESGVSILGRGVGN